MFSVFSYNTLICICSITLLYMLINKFTINSVWRKSAQDIGSFENGNSVQKNGVHDFTCTRRLICKNNTLLQRNSTVIKETKAVIFISLKIFPKPAKTLHMSYNVNFSEKHPCSIPLKEYLVVYGSQPTSKVGSHRLHYCENIFFHLSQFMIKFTFEKCFLLVVQTGEETGARNVFLFVLQSFPHLSDRWNRQPF